MSGDSKHDIVVEIQSKPRLMQAIRGLVRGYVGSLGFPKDSVDDVVLAVDEACCNSIRHAYGGKDDGTLYLRLDTDGDMLEVELYDEGAPAPAERVARKELVTPDLDALTPGGLGVPLIYKVFDEVEFIPGQTQGNRLVMRLRTHASNARPGDGEA